MKTRLVQWLMIGLLAWLAAGQAQAEEAAAYRVDVIVFLHLAGESDQRYTPEISDFGEYLDPETNARAAAWIRPDDPVEISSEEQARLDALATLDQLRALENTDRSASGRFRGGPAFPTPWLGLGSMAMDMASAWQRLEASPRHEPLVWRSWYQSLDQGGAGRWMRLRGGRLLDLDWLEQETADPRYLEDHAPGPYPFLLPRSRHQLDGVLRLRQRQFMHADLDLVWQDPVEAEPSPLDGDWFWSRGYEVHPLQQSRSIRPGRIEYFDSSWLGVLIRIQERESQNSPSEADRP
jgi:hypothetical protein